MSAQGPCSGLGQGEAGHYLDAQPFSDADFILDLVLPRGSHFPTPPLHASSPPPSLPGESRLRTRTGRSQQPRPHRRGCLREGGAPALEACRDPRLGAPRCSVSAQEPRIWLQAPNLGIGRGPKAVNPKLAPPAPVPVARASGRGVWPLGRQGRGEGWLEKPGGPQTRATRRRVPGPFRSWAEASLEPLMADLRKD